MWRIGRPWLAVITGLLVPVFFVSTVFSARFTSTDYIIDASVMNNAGGNQSSSSYKLTSSAGESITGNGSSGSYKLGAGYVAQLEKQSGSSIKLVTQPSGLVAYYPFDENSGTSTTKDESINTANGTLVSAPTWTTGKLGAALQFNGTSQVVDMGNGTQFQTSQHSVSAWVKYTSNTTDQVVAGKGQSYALVVGSKPGVRQFSGTPSTCSSTGLTTNDGAWHHLVVTVDAGVTNGTKLYLDGALVQSCTVTIAAQTENFAVGALDAGSTYSNFYTGAIDEVKVFNRILSAAEVSAEYSAQNSGVPSGIALANIIPGSPVTTGLTAIVTTTGATSYNLAINQDHDLQKGTDTIPAISGTIASPAAWTDGTTKGLGFTVSSSPAAYGSWSNGTNFAAVPNSSTTFYVRNSPQNGVKESVGLTFKADTTLANPAGSYADTVTVTGTVSP